MHYALQKQLSEKMANLLSSAFNEVIMRLFSTFFILLCSYQLSYACFCLGPAFTEYLDELCGEEKTLIFRGSYIQSDSMMYGYEAMQFKVEELYYGQIITMDSPLFQSDSHPSTDSTVWILSGSEASCHRWIAEKDAIFALTYTGGFSINGGTFGYIPTICENDYFPISESGTITGRILEQNVNTSLSLQAFDALLQMNCLTPIIDLQGEAHSINPVIYPQPASTQIFIRTEAPLDNWKIALVNTSGKVLNNIKDPVVDVSVLIPGVYFLRFTMGGQVVIRKFIKV